MSTTDKPVSDNKLYVKLGGGEIGDYTLKVLNVDKGFSLENIVFKYSMIITSISPNTGD